MLPRCAKQLYVIHNKHGLILETKVVYYALWNTFGE